MPKICSVVLILSLMAGPAYATETRAVDVLFLELKALGGFDADQALLIENVILAELSKHKQFNVISKSDVVNMLDVEQLKQSVNCSQESCIAEIAGALGTEYLVTGNLGNMGDGEALLNLQWLSNKEGRVVARVSSSLTGTGAALVPQVQRGVLQLIAGYDPSFDLNANVQRLSGLESKDESSVLKSWWLWTGLAAVAGGVVAGVVLSGGSTGDGGTGTLQGSVEVGP